MYGDAHCTYFGNGDYYRQTIAFSSFPSSSFFTTLGLWVQKAHRKHIAMANHRCIYIECETTTKYPAEKRSKNSNGLCEHCTLLTRSWNERWQMQLTNYDEKLPSNLALIFSTRALYSSRTSWYRGSGISPTIIRQFYSSTKMHFEYIEYRYARKNTYSTSTLPRNTKGYLFLLYVFVCSSSWICYNILPAHRFPSAKDKTTTNQKVFTIQTFWMNIHWAIVWEYCNVSGVKLVELT